jgi:hypothetical protein
MLDDDRLVTVATFDLLMQAEFAKGLLEGEGIRCFVADGELVNIDWLLSGAVGRIKLQVAESDFLAAERILNSSKGKAAVWGKDDYGLGPSRQAITTDPDAIRDDEDDKDEEEDEDDQPDNAAEVLVGQAVRFAVFGLLLCPPVLQIYSLTLLWRVGRLELPLRARQRRLYWMTVVLDAIVVLIAVGIVVLVFGGPPPERR